MASEKLKLSAGIVSIVANALVLPIYVVYITLFIVLSGNFYGNIPAQVCILLVICIFGVLYSVSMIIVGARLCENRESKKLTIAMIVLSAISFSTSGIAIFVLLIIYLIRLDKEACMQVQRAHGNVYAEGAGGDVSLEMKLVTLKGLKEDGIIGEKEYEKAVFGLVNKEGLIE